MILRLISKKLEKSNEYRLTFDIADVCIFLRFVFQVGPHIMHLYRSGALGKKVSRFRPQTEVELLKEKEMRCCAEMKATQ
jgi:hypothetical protein